MCVKTGNLVLFDQLVEENNLLFCKRGVYVSVHGHRHLQLLFAQLRTRVYSNLVINIARYLGRKNIPFQLIRLGLQGKGEVTDEEINCLTSSAASKVSAGSAVECSGICALIPTSHTGRSLWR